MKGIGTLFREYPVVMWIVTIALAYILIWKFAMGRGRSSYAGQGFDSPAPSPYVPQGGPTMTGFAGSDSTAG